MIEQTSAVRRADCLHDAGERLLAEGLHDLLSGYGRACYTGSFYLNVMVWPDLDVYLPLDSSDEFLDRFLGLGARVASGWDVVSLSYKNHVRYPEKALPSGLYWGIRLQQDPSTRWKLDLWAVPRGIIDTNHGELERLKTKLTPDTRVKIIQLKQAFLTAQGRTPVFSGYHLYRAVLDHGLSDYDQVRQYLAENGVPV